MDILYHIGLPRTGSTWLQRELFVNWVGYERIGPMWEARLHLEEEKNLVRVYSGEEMSIGHRKKKTNFQERARILYEQGFDAKVLLILREPKRWLYSIYQEQVREIRTSVSLSRFLLSRHGIGDVNHEVGEVGYDELIEVYYGLFGKDKILVLPYELFLRDPTLYITRILQFSSIDHIEDKVKRLPVHRKIHTSSSPFRVQSYRVLTYFLFQPNLELYYLPSGRCIDLMSQPSRGHLYPLLKSKTIKRQFSRIRWLDENIIPRRYNAWLKQRWQSEINYWVGNKYKASNARASQLIGIDLAQYGYDI